MDIDTEITGDAGSISAAASWLRDQLAPETTDAANAFNTSRLAAEEGWISPAGTSFQQVMARGRTQGDELSDGVKDMANDLDDFANTLTTCQHGMAAVRESAIKAGLRVNGFIVCDPGEPTAKPPRPTPAATEAQVKELKDAHSAWVTQCDRHQAFNQAESEAERLDRKYAWACERLESQYTVSEHARWIVSFGEILGEGAAAGVGAAIAAQKSALHFQAEMLIAEAKRSLEDMQAHPERYIKRKWFFFKRINWTRLNADVAAIDGKFTEATRLMAESHALDSSRALRYVGRAGKALGPLGFGLGVYNDWQEGETTQQIVVSQGVSTAVGIGAGVGASALTGMALGAACGSVVPGVGTVIGAAVGTAVGAATAIFTDGMIDSLFENGPDVGKAFSAGTESLAGTGEAIGDGVSGMANAVGSWFH